jgi:predicted site-specific integrase-resolvase
MSELKPILKPSSVLLTRRQVAELLAVSTESVKRYTRRGLLPSIKLNSRVIRYRPEDVQRMIEAAS